MARNFVDNVKLQQAFLAYHGRPDVIEFMEAKATHIAARDRGDEPGRFTLVPPQLPDEIGKAIYLIVNNFAMRQNWRHLHCIEDMIGDAIIHCVSYVYNYNPYKFSNPFAYITQCARNGFLQRIDKEKDQEDLKVETVKRMVTGQNDSYEGGDFFVPTFVSSAMDVIDEVEEMNASHGVRGGSRKIATKKVKKSSELEGF